MGPLLVLLITFLAVSDGFLLASLVKKHFSLWERLCAGAVVGLALLAWIGFLTAFVGGLNATTIITTVFILTAILVTLRRVSPSRVDFDKIRASVSQLDRGGMLYYGLWALLLAWLFSRVVMFEGGGLETAPLNNYGDLPFHLSVITSFAWGDNFPPQNPIFAGYRFTYPFLVDFLTAFNLGAGAGWRVAFFVENFILAISLVGLIEMLAFRLTGSRLAARLAPVIFLFNGGFGFLIFFRDLASSHNLFEFLGHLPRSYTMNAELTTPFGQVPLQWGNVFTTLLIPQRSLLFGLPFVALILTLWWIAFGEKTETRDRRRLLIFAGVLAGTLPMLHAHGFFSVMIASAALVFIFWSLDWIAFFVPAIALAAPQALYLSGTPVRNQLFKPHWAWVAGESPAILFWFANAGVFLLLLIAPLVGRGLVEARARRFYLGFILWFVLPNVVFLAPWPWDNIKVLVYWSLASSPFVAAVLSDGFRRGIMWRVASATLLVVLILSGVLDVVRALSPVEKALLFDPQKREVADLIRAATEPRALIVHAPIHNSVLCLTGRQSFMGYPGHLWTHGIDYSTRELDLQTIYRGGLSAKQLIAQYGIDYVLVGPVERETLKPDEALLAAEYPIVVDHAGHRLYRVER